MARVTDIVSASSPRPVFLCDFSPPPRPCPNWTDQASALNPDILSVPYLAPHPTRPDPITAAHLLRDRTRAEVVFTLSTRDAAKSKALDKLARARALALENVVVLQGDADRGVPDAPLNQRFKPTELIRELKGANWNFCIGAVADLAKGIETEADLCLKKIESGADFLLIQPTFDLEATQNFLSRTSLPVPLFFGVQVLAKGSISFTPVPDHLRSRIQDQNAGVEIAVESIRRFLRFGINCFYLIPPILPGGPRDYAVARRVMDSFTPV